MNEVAKSCDDQQEQAMSLFTSFPFTATESTFLHFKYFGDWRGDTSLPPPLLF